MLLAGSADKFGDPIGLGSTLSLALVTTPEFICALLIILGLGTRLAAVPVVISMSVGGGSPTLGDHNWPKGFWSQITNRIPLPRGRGGLPLRGLLRRPRPGPAPRRPTPSPPGGGRGLPSN